MYYSLEVTCTTLIKTYMYDVKGRLLPSDHNRWQHE